MYFVKRNMSEKKIAIPQKNDAPRKKAYPHAATNKPNNPAIKTLNAPTRPTITLGFPRIFVVRLAILFQKSMKVKP